MLKAIETRYKGYRFRSRLEARWAVFFDACGVRWEYEKEGFTLPGIGGYLPDFWLSAPRVWVEIKPETPTPEEALKMKRLCELGNHIGMIVAGMPGEEQIWLFEPKGMLSLDATKGYPVWCDLFMFGPNPGRDVVSVTPRTSEAYRAARAARFEHGENGNVR